MKVSIITVCRNSILTIRDAVDSVLAQKGAEIECLVVDGGSVDGTVDVLKGYGARITWISEPDKGMYDALNKGIRMATGDLVGIVNADDALAADDVIARLVAAWQQIEKSGRQLDAVYGDIRFVTGNLQGVAALQSAPTRRYCSGKFFRPWMFRFGTQIAHPSFYCRRACFERHGFYLIDFGMYADFELLVRFFLKHRIRTAYLPLCTTVMRMGGASTNGVKSVIKINVSDLKALRLNGIWSCLPLIYLKYLFKVWGFVLKKKTVALLVALAAVWTVPTAEAKSWPGFSCGMGIGGWLTNYKRFNVLPEEWRLPITIGDLEHFDTYMTEADVARIKGWGFDHVRLGFDQIVLEEKPFVYRERTFRRLDAFVGWCRKHGVNLVLNLHKAIGNYCDIAEKTQLLDDDGLQNRFVALWLEIERRYHDQPGLAFELLNEVRNVKPEKWNALADRTLKAIRAQNPTRDVVIGSICWNSPSRLKDLKIWNDPHVIYTFHMYEPFDFTHQRGVLQAGPLYYNRVMPYPTADVARYREANELRNPKSKGGYAGVKAIDRAFLKGCLKGAIDFAAAHPDLVLWNGEFGTIRHAPPAARVAYMRDVISICREAGIPYCVWNYLSTPNDGNRFSLVDDDMRAFLSPELLSACLGKETSASSKSGVDVQK